MSNASIKEFGGTGGGPIILPKLYNGRDKTFFFFALEPRRVNDSGNVYNLFPTAAMRGGDFSNTVYTAAGTTTQDVINSFAAKGIKIPVTADSTIYQQFTTSGNQFLRNPVPSGTASYPVFPGGIIPQSLLDPTAIKLLKYLPLPSQAPFVQPNGNLAHWVGQRNVVSDDNRYQYRVDHQITQNNKLYLRSSHIPITGYRYNNLSPGEAATNGPTRSTRSSATSA